MSKLRAAVIGTNKPEKPSKVGFGMGYSHGQAYAAIPQKCELAACADLIPERAEAFADQFGVPVTYTDYKEMLDRENLDIVSIATWPHLHERMVVDCTDAGVGAVHCEKPISTTWGSCRRMVSYCRQKGVQLTFNHQRRFGKPFRNAKRLLDDGAVGDLVEMQFGGNNMCDYGSHNFDMCGYFNDQTPVEWVLGQIDYSREDKFFGMHNENQAVVRWRYENGVYGYCATGPRGIALPFHNRIIGTEGVIEIGPRGDGLPVLRVMRKGSAQWESIDCEGETCHGPGFHERAIEHVVDCLVEGKAPELRGENALQSTEVIFAAWECCRRRSRVDMPLEIEDNPLAQMVDSGALRPEPEE